jgi:DNA-binding CsgD family transcriptional regulator
MKEVAYGSRDIILKKLKKVLSERELPPFFTLEAASFINSKRRLQRAVIAASNTFHNRGTAKRWRARQTTSLYGGLAMVMAEWKQVQRKLLSLSHKESAQSGLDLVGAGQLRASIVLGVDNGIARIAVPPAFMTYVYSKELCLNYILQIWSQQNARIRGVRFEVDGRLRSQNIGDEAPTDRREYPLLTNRERECFVWACRGKTRSDTADILGISDRTVEFHFQNAMRKLRVRNKFHAIALAIHLGLISP